MKRVMFLFRGLFGIPAYTSARPQSEVVRSVHVGMSRIPADTATKALPLTRGLLSMLVRQAGDTRPSRILRPHPDPKFLSDLQAAFSKMLARPTPDRAGGLKVTQNPRALDDEALPRLSRVQMLSILRMD